MAELLWPTRCIVCDAAGQVLCDACARSLRFVDLYRACPRCGAPFGRLVCTECNSYSMRDAGRSRLPFRQCVSAVVFDERSARIVRGRKDNGERRLAHHMALAMARVVPLEWLGCACVTSVPSTKAAVRSRGFDHAYELARELAALLGMPCQPVLRTGQGFDQRALARRQRFANMEGRFAATSPGGQGAWDGCVLLADDVYTTGATLMAASDALLEAGFSQVRCVTFARVY